MHWERSVLSCLLYCLKLCLTVTETLRRDNADFAVRNLPCGSVQTPSNLHHSLRLDVGIHMHNRQHLPMCSHQRFLEYSCWSAIGDHGRSMHQCSPLLSDQRRHQCSIRFCPSSIGRYRSRMPAQSHSTDNVICQPIPLLWRLKTSRLQMMVLTAIFTLGLT